MASLRVATTRNAAKKAERNPTAGVDFERVVLMPSAKPKHVTIRQIKAAIAKLKS